ncbi:hypothetical protein niasHT_021144 [Heterodera trifolii]|uniref:Uncharacterized protein n=1 Tax=Heterodera trifolii TaxID=157864 RepID=A0ABD2JF49_9BILA
MWAKERLNVAPLVKMGTRNRRRIELILTTDTGRTEERWGRKEQKEGEGRKGGEERSRGSVSATDQLGEQRRDSGRKWGPKLGKWAIHSFIRAPPLSVFFLPFGALKQKMVMLLGRMTMEVMGGGGGGRELGRVGGKGGGETCSSVSH